MIPPFEKELEKVIDTDIRSAQEIERNLCQSCEAGFVMLNGDCDQCGAHHSWNNSDFDPIEL